MNNDDRDFIRGWAGFLMIVFGLCSTIVAIFATISLCQDLAR